jgi:hypothetical protein
VGRRERRGLAQAVVVPVQTDVDRARRGLRAFDLAEARTQPFGDRGTAGQQSDQDDVGRALVPLRDLVRDARDRSSEVLLGQDRRGGGEVLVASQGARLPLCGRLQRSP